MTLRTLNVQVKKSFMTALVVLGASVGLLAGMTGSVGASALQKTGSAAGGDESAVNRIVNANADPIKACGPHPADKDGSSWGRYFKVNGVNIRKYPNTHSKICAQGQKSHRVDYHCWKVGSDGYTWTYLRDVNTHYAGWVRDDLLKNYGSAVHC